MGGTYPPKPRHKSTFQESCRGRESELLEVCIIFGILSNCETSKTPSCSHHASPSRKCSSSTASPYQTRWTTPVKRSWQELLRSSTPWLNNCRLIPTFSSFPPVLVLSQPSGCRKLTITLQPFRTRCQGYLLPLLQSSGCEDPTLLNPPLTVMLGAYRSG